ncbi:hypothetical protein C4K68_05600 [Pokkaliibacter plantistimulans]|uniref:Uncharacterized protein n=1 Tax=Proteobacteria bacterium 228 TaxID=2083153 RepID=A0A2S5KUH9_9PROT|nr:SH3 domain-containing protein [Pokkaliibacter plantistimulans]PPC78517.1 hypothetical protein C4K68_05600 [Pokkaliibacter plantistimulans]
MHTAFRFAIGLVLIMVSGLSQATDKLFQPTDSFTRFYRDLSQAIEKQDREAVMALVADNFRYERDPDGIFSKQSSGKDNFARVFLPSPVPEGYKKQIWQNLRSSVTPRLLFSTQWGVCPAPLPALEDIRARTDLHYLASIDKGNVRLRAAPSLQSAVLDEVSNADVMVVGSDSGEPLALSPKANILTSAPDLWLKVQFNHLNEAYVHSSLVSFWELPRFCFAQEKGEWRLAAFVNGQRSQ